MDRTQGRQREDGTGEHPAEPAYGSITNTTYAAIRKLQEEQADAEATLQLERDISASPEVLAAEKIVELYVQNVDPGASDTSGLRAFRAYFAAAKQPGAPGHGDMLRRALAELEPAAAVLSFRKVDTHSSQIPRVTMGRGRRREPAPPVSAIVEVPSDAVADFFCHASQRGQQGGGDAQQARGDAQRGGTGVWLGGRNGARGGRYDPRGGRYNTHEGRGGRPPRGGASRGRGGPNSNLNGGLSSGRGRSAAAPAPPPPPPPPLPPRGINCAPRGKAERYVSIKRNNRRHSEQGGSAATTLVLEVRHVSIVDIDFSEVVRGAPAVAGGHYRARQLWKTAVDQAGIDLRAQAIRLERRASVALSIDLKAIKHIKLLSPEIEGGQHSLALRLRRPPTLNALPPAWTGLMPESTLPRGTDPSDCEAFASPTAFVCLAFDADSPHAFDTGLKAFHSFRMNIHTEGITARMEGSRHAGVCGGVSHRLPPTLWPLTRDDFVAVGDTGFRVAYQLDLLLRHGHLRAADVPEALELLRCLCERQVFKSFTAYLCDAADDLPPFHHCNSGLHVIEELRKMYSSGIRFPRRHSTRREAADGPERPSGAASPAPSGARSAAGPSANDYGPDEASHNQEAPSPLNAGNACVAPDNDAAADKEEPTRAAPAAEEEEAVEEEEGIMRPRRVIVTPLRALPFPSASEVSNRIIRRYAKFKDRFLRVVFASESLTSINYLDLSDAICDRIRHLLANGLTVGTYPFVFLAFSNSQLREHSCWLYCEAGRQSDGAPSADDIRQSIGELHALRTPAKFAARLGQGFSTTFETFRFDRGSVCVLPDVKARDGKLFSDGVGVITSEGMKKVVDRLPVRMRRGLTGTLPSAIQIRLGGCKGMLALWDNIRGMRPGALVGIRPSMKKFESTDLAVEVCELARPMPAAINRQLIMALLSLKVDARVFQRKYDAHVHQLGQLLAGRDLQQGLGVLRTIGAYPAHSPHGVGVAQESLAACMLEAGISPREDIFLMALCQAHRTFALKNVQEKCRVPLDEAVNLIGVMDESGTLPPGTFWASWDQNRGRRTPDNPDADPDVRPLPPGTRAAVTRFPCLAPADVRVLRAADPSTLSPALTVLTNVIVFPSVGSPEPCKMSGGDLDGDIYLLTWDPELIPKREAVAVDYAPVDYPMEQLTPVIVSQTVDFFIGYMKNDQLGRIANAHLSIADFARDESGNRIYANDIRCHKLVHLHSTAVDFAKTGVPVEPADVAAAVVGRKLPDYLGGSFVSKTVIGEITRDAKRVAESGEVVQWSERAGEGGGWLLAADPELLLASELLEGKMEAAERLLCDWTWDVCQLMRRFGAADVGQVFAGCVREFTGRAAGREKQMDQQKQLDTALAVLIERSQRRWFPGIEPAAVPAVLDQDVLRRAVASEVPFGHQAAGATSPSARERPDPATQQDMLCAASALYKAAHASHARNNVSAEEALIRRACPWRVAPRLLLQLKLHHGAKQCGGQHAGHERHAEHVELDDFEWP